VDGEVWKDFHEHQEVRIKSLYERLQAGTYRDVLVVDAN
jgi:hypothetical protein